MHAIPPSERSAVVNTVENCDTPRRVRHLHRSALDRIPRNVWSVAAIACLATSAHASIFQGETLDKVANVLAWVVLAVVPIVGIGVFWLVHILPEKIAEKRQHPQTHAIQTLCLLSLVFGGLLWPLAWIWAYTKPVMYKMAYGTDRDETIGHGKAKSAPSAPEDELASLRKRVAELEADSRDAGAKGRG